MLSSNSSYFFKLSKSFTHGRVKSEMEKMLDGEFYVFDKDPNILKGLQRSRRYAKQFNETKPAETEKRQKIWNEWLKQETDSIVEPPVRCDYGMFMKMGKNCRIGRNFTILDTCPVKIGDNCIIGPNVSIFAAAHPTDIELRYQSLDFGQPINIGNNVYIGPNSIICPGVTIGDNSFISAGSMVNKNIPPNVVVGGLPAKILKTLNVSN